MAGEEYDLSMLGDEPDAEQKRAAIVAALRGQIQAKQRQAGFDRAWGGMGLLTGDKVLGQFGAAKMQDAQHADVMAGQQDARMGAVGKETMNNAIQKAIALKAQEAQARSQTESERHNRRAEGLQQQQVEAGKYTLSNPEFGQPYVFNTKEGTATPLGDRTFRPPPGAAGANNQLAKNWEGFYKLLDTGSGRANLNVEQQKRLNASERIKKIAENPDGTVKNLPPELVTELVGSLGSLIVGGHPSEGMLHALMPKGMGMKEADIKEFLTNNPQGANQQAFIKMAIDLSNREEDLISEQIRNQQAKGLPHFAHLKKNDPDKWGAMLRAAKHNPDDYNDLGEVIKKAAAKKPITAAPVEMTPEKVAAAKAFIAKHPDDERSNAAAEVWKQRLKDSGNFDL